MKDNFSRKIFDKLVFSENEKYNCKIIQKKILIKFYPAEIQLAAGSCFVQTEGSAVELEGKWHLKKQFFTLIFLGSRTWRESVQTFSDPFVPCCS